MKVVKVSNARCCENAKCLAGRLATAPIRARLRAVAAKLHRAPSPRSVRRLVVERPAAMAACLEPGPRAVEHRAEGDLDDAVEWIADGPELQAACGVELDPEPRRGDVDRLDRSVLERQGVVREGERAQRLAKRLGSLQLPVEIVAGEPL